MRMNSPFGVQLRLGIIIVIGLVTLIQQVSSAGKTLEEHEEICRLTVSDRDKGKKDTPCAFPFRYNGTKWDGVCTNSGDPDGEYWCSTKTGRRGGHLPGGGNWGYCHKGCEAKPVVRNLEESREHCKTTLSDDGPKLDTPCIFPFKFKGKQYDGVCTNALDKDGRYWCATAVIKKGRRKGALLPGGSNWGYCQPGCDIEPVEGGGGSNEVTTPRSGLTTKRTRCRKKDKACKGKGECTGPYCDQDFWNIGEEELKKNESKINSWIDYNRETEPGNYYPNEYEGTCGLDTKSGYIVGGEKTKIGEYPYMANLGYRKRGRIFYNCGATLINRRYVVTAAHCHDTSSEDKQISQVVVGDHDLSTNPDCITEDNGDLSCNNKPVQRFDVELDAITVHEDWEPARVTDKANDIALVRLPRPAYTANEVSRGVHVMPICLPWGKLPDTRDVAQFPEERGEYVVTGWGRTNNNKFDVGGRFEGGAHSNALLQLKIPFIPNETCRSDYKAFSGITPDKQICAGGLRGKDSCQGDSGGPLMVRKGEGDFMYLIGIVSFGTQKCGKGYPGVYTSVEYYMPWIKSNLKP